jgi:hypothetical protein
MGDEGLLEESDERERIMRVVENVDNSGERDIIFA